MNSTKSLWEILISLLYICVGFVLAIYPENLIRGVCFALGALTLVYGASRLLMVIIGKRAGFLAYADLFIGVLMAGIGAVLILSPEIVVSIIPIIVGLVVVFTAISKLSQAMELKEIKYEKWWTMLLTSLLMMLLGTLLVVNPFKSATLMLRVVGIVLAINGCLSIFGTAFTGKQVRHYRKVENVSATDAQTGEELYAEVIDTDGKVI